MRDRFNLDTMRARKKRELPAIAELLHKTPDRKRAHVEISLADSALSPVRVLAEVKKSSPTLGAVRSRDALSQARAYARGGAWGISVLTDAPFFGGSWQDLKNVASRLSLPVLCKEFVYYKEQIELAFCYGADLVLLIARVLEDRELIALYAYILKLGMTPLVEVHEAGELERVLDLNPKLLLVNSRNLKTLDMEPETAMETLKSIPGNITRVSASGIRSPQEISRFVEESATRFFLVGSALMQAADPENFLKELCHVC